MAGLSRVNGWVSGIIRLVLMDNSSTTGGALVGLSSASANLIISTIADVEAAPVVYSSAGATIDTIATPGTYAAPAANHCRFKEVDSTNNPGLYELQFANARFAVANAGALVVTIAASGASHCSPQHYQIDLDAQVDARSFGGQPGSFSGGLAAVNVTQIAGVATNATKLALELAGRLTGTVTSVGVAPTPTQFECGDITSAAAFPLFLNRGFLVTSGAQAGAIGVILGDAIGTAGRRLQCASLPGGALANGDTIVIL